MATRLTINGATVDARSDPDTPLLYVLSGELGLNGAKYGCGLGQCGACSVILDGEAVASCTVPLSSVAGREVTTLEGLGTLEAPGPMQRAFIAENAAQCGFCIPGMIVRAQAALAADPEASEADIRDALQNNLCRCGTHVRILRAVRRAQAEMRGATGEG